MSSDVRDRVALLGKYTRKAFEVLFPNVSSCFLWFVLHRVLALLLCPMVVYQVHAWQGQPGSSLRFSGYLLPNNKI